MPVPYRAKVEAAVALLSDREAIRFALDCVTRALPVWLAVFPDDERPRAAVDAASRWMSGGASVEELAQTGLAASNAATEADDPERVPSDARLTAALNSAVAASHAALAAEYAIRRREDLTACVAWVASFALCAAPVPDTEEKWQTARLDLYMTGQMQMPVA